MRLRFLAFCASPDGGYAAGTVAEVDDLLAQSYLDKGRAEVVRRGRPPRERTVELAPETR